MKFQPSALREPGMIHNNTLVMLKKKDITPVPQMRNVSPMNAYDFCDTSL